MCWKTMAFHLEGSDIGMLGLFDWFLVFQFFLVKVKVRSKVYAIKEYVNLLRYIFEVWNTYTDFINNLKL